MLRAMEIRIRRAEPEDHESVWRILADPDTFPGTLQLPHPSREMWRKRFAEHSESDYILVACVDGEIVGHAGLHPVAKSPRRSHAMSLGITVRRDFQGRGVGGALLKAILDLADNWLNVFRVELTVYTDNERALALYRRFGFEVEGTHRAYALRAGRYVDSHSMARLRPKPAPEPAASVPARD